MQQLITGLLSVVYIPLNMFRVSLCTSSGALSTAAAAASGLPQAAAAGDRLLMMGIRMSETC
jgi:hypothetical protein